MDAHLLAKGDRALMLVDLWPGLTSFTEDIYALEELRVEGWMLSSIRSSSSASESKQNPGQTQSKIKRHI